MDLTEYLAVLRRRWLVIVLAGLLGAGAGFGLARTTEPLYRSTTTTFVSLARGGTVAELVQGTTYTQNLVESFTRLATMPAVLDPVVDELGLDMSTRSLARTITAVTPLGTMFVEITAISPDPAQAAAVADAVAASLALQVETLTPGSGSSPVVRMTVVAEAVAPNVPFTPNTRRDTALGGVAGVVLGVLGAFALALLDTRVRRTADLPQRPDTVVLGLLPRDRDARRARPAILVDPDGPLAESCRRVQTNLQFISAASRVRSFVVSSSVAGEGRSTVALNVAAALAEKGSRVLLVDADLRTPALAALTGLADRPGLTTVLVGSATLDDVAAPWGPPGLDVVVAGELPPNPAQLIDSPAMQELLDAAVDRYDVVILDTPPLLPVTDAAVLARHTDGLVMVVGSGHARRTQVAAAMTILDTIDARCLGTVLNGVSAAEAGTARLRGAGRQPVTRWGRRQGGAKVPVGTPPRSGPTDDRAARASGRGDHRLRAAELPRRQPTTPADDDTRSAGSPARPAVAKAVTAEEADPHVGEQGTDERIAV